MVFGGGNKREMTMAYHDEGRHLNYKMMSIFGTAKLFEGNSN